jgi:hypothetical protein
MFHGSERSGVTTENVGTAKRTAEGRQSGSFGTIVKNEEFLLEEVVGGRDCEGRGVRGFLVWVWTMK